MAKKAILYGINEYKHPNVSDLRGCVNDVENISELLIDEFGFDDDDVRVRTDYEVTLDTIKSDWKWLVKNAAAEDQLVFHFSGHGSQVADDSGEEDDDGLDEILCLYDMDFDDPDTYLLDDQIHKWTRKLPDGVKMTFILDCCHSGTGTRSLNPGLRSLDQTTRSLARVISDVTTERGNLADVRRAMKQRTRLRSTGGGEDTKDPDIVLARYLVPPSDVYRRVEKRAIRRSNSSRSTSQSTNHVRFSGCKDEQPSADAFIDGDFQGAFTAYFLKTITNEGADISHSDLIKRIRAALEEANFRQTPQLNPKKLETSVFEGVDGTMHPVEDDESGAATGKSHRSSDVRLLVKKIDELIDAMQFRSSGPCGRRKKHRTRQKDESHSRPSRREYGKRSIVYVHGICWHEDGYSDDWFEALRSHLNRSLADELSANHNEVLWSRHVSTGPRDLTYENDPEHDTQQLVFELRDILNDRAAQAIEYQISPSHTRGGRSEIRTRDVQRAFLGISGLDCIDDFAKYLLFRRVRRRVLAEFTSVVEPLLEEGHEIELITHSWGTVVALEGLHQLSGGSYQGYVNNLFTVGSALSIGSVQRRLKFGAETGAKPSLVGNWINLDARGDIVGGTLRGFSTEIDAEYLNLDPVGCREGIFGVSRCSHSSYFDENNITVNRDIFAEWISSD